MVMIMMMSHPYKSKIGLKQNACFISNDLNVEDKK
jgi:hypothetical protein